MEVVTKKIVKLVAIYARVSTARQEQEGTIATQISAIKEFADKNGYTIVQEYKDDGWSGSNIVRPALDQLRVDAKKKLWDAVLFYDPDRLARRYFYQELVIDELKQLGLQALFVTMPQSKNSEDDLMYGVRGVFAEYERAKITERFRLGKVRKAKEGHIVTTEAPYGYAYIRKTESKQGYYEVNEEEARVVKMIFNWVIQEGLTIRSIVRKLQELKIQPKRSKRGVWNTSTLSTLLRNSAYIGEAHYLKNYGTVPLKPLKNEIYKKVKKTSRRTRPQEEWIMIPVPHIIDKEIFEKVGKRLRDNFALCIRNKKNQYLLAGKIWCTCGQRRTGEGPMHGKHLYYRCSNRVYSFPLPRTCHEGGINARIADDIVWKRIVKFMTSPELITREAKNWINQRENVSEISSISVMDIEKQIGKLKKEEERYVKAYGAEAITLEQLKEHTVEIKDKVSGLRGQIIYLDQQKKQSQAVNLPSQDDLMSFCQKVKDMLDYLKFDTKQKVIRDMVEKITANQKELLVEGYLTINEDYYVEHETSYRNRRTPECGEVDSI